MSTRDVQQKKRQIYQNMNNDWTLIRIDITEKKRNKCILDLSVLSVKISVFCEKLLTEF